MKKSLRIYISLFFSVFFIISIIACNNSAETKLVYTENDTIKQSVKEREQGITWTQELEKDRLTTRITRSSMEIGSDVPYNKELFKISKTMQAPVYPDLNDFGSLDTRNIREAVKDKMNNFCSNLSLENHTGADSFFSKKYIFNYVFFVKELEEGWKTNFNEEYPKSALTEKKPEEDGGEEPAPGIFTKWTFGEPFIGSEIMQIPVRFYATCGIIDVTVFLNSSGNNEFYQITINRWKKV